MVFLETVKGHTKSQEKSQLNNSTEPTEIDVSKAVRIEFPKLKFEKDPDPSDSIEQDWKLYYLTLEKAHSHYNRKWYGKSKDEFLKIYEWYHKDKMYYTYLLRAYRKLVDSYIKKKKFKEAFVELEDMFKKCSNYTNADINMFNKVANQLNKNITDKNISLKESIITDEPNYCIDSTAISFLQEIKNPKGYNASFTNEVSILNLKSKTEFLPTEIPNIEFDINNIIFKNIETISSIPHNIYRFRESSNKKSFITSTKELLIYIYDWDMKLLHSFDASNYADEHTHLRRIELSADLSHFLFTVVDKAYLLDAKMNLISIWQIPHKDGFEKRVNGKSTEINNQVKDYLRLLELSDKPTKEEIKTAFRKLVLKVHPDRNPDNPQAGEITKQLIQAYEYLSGEDAQSAFAEIDKKDFHWVDLNNIFSFEVAGMTFEMSMSLSSGEDWIYGAGISNDGSRIYLGGYSGKIYQVNQKGIAEKIYFAPEDKSSVYGQSNPISYILEYNDRKYILSTWYLYILRDDKTIKFLKNNNGLFRWYSNGFISQRKNGVVFYDMDGNETGKLTFKSPINQICFKDNIILVVTTTKAFTFKQKSD